MLNLRNGFHFFCEFFNWAFVSTEFSALTQNLCKNCGVFMHKLKFAKTFQCFLTSFSARNLQKFQGLPRFWCTSAEQNEVCGVFSALSVKIFQAFAPVFVHNFNALVVTAVCNVKRATLPLEHVGRYDNVQPQKINLSRKNNASLAQTTGLRGTCNVRTSEVTSYVLDGPVTRHLKLWFLKFFNPKSSNAQVLQDSKICNILNALKVETPRFCNAHMPHVLDLRWQLYNDFGGFWMPLTWSLWSANAIDINPICLNNILPGLSLWHWFSTVPPPPPPHVTNTHQTTIS